MTSEPRDQKQDAEFEQNLESVSAAWNELEKAEPPDLLDQAVLNTAQRELETGRKRRSLRWAGALATASIVVIALGIVVQQEPGAPAPPSGPVNGIKLDHDSMSPEKKESPGNIARENEIQPQLKKQRMEQTAPPGEFRPKRSAAPASEATLAPAASPVSSATLSSSLEEAREEALGETDSLADAPDDFLQSPEPAPDPETWIERMLALKVSKQDEILQKELAKFRLAYPEYPLPADLSK